MVKDEIGCEGKLALGLGWFSLGLGLAQVLAPRRVARAIGVDEKESKTLLRLCGAREIVAGAGILAQRKSGTWLWRRFLGDAMDLGMLGAALISPKSRKGRVLAAATAVTAISALDMYCSLQFTKRNSAPHKVRVSKCVTIDRSPEELYQFWSRFDRLAAIMNHVESVEMLDEKRSRWKAKGPAGMIAEWDAEITIARPNELIAWRSLPGADVNNTGVVQFEPARGGRGTVVRVELEYAPPAGPLGAKLAMLFGEAPEKQIDVDLRRFKQMMETGEIARTEGQSAGRPRSTSKIYDDFVRT